MRIGELAERVGVNPKTIRFYEDQGLLPPPARRPTGYRDYDTGDETRLKFVRTAQRLGFALSEISEILALKERGERPCDYVLGVLDHQVADIDRRLGELVALRAELLDLKAKADQLDLDSACYCALIEHARSSHDKAHGRPALAGSRSDHRRPVTPP